MSNLKDRVREALTKVADPHMGINIVDMGLIENIEIIKDNKTIAKVTIKPTNPACMSAAKWQWMQNKWLKMLKVSIKQK